MAGSSRHLSQKEIFQTIAGGMIGLTVVSIALFQGYDPLVFILGLAAFYPSYIIGVCLHEYGHVLGAWAGGGHVSRVELGRHYPQWKPWKIRFLGVRWQINSAPLSGAAHVMMLDTTNYRLRQCWMIACGPLTNLILLIAGVIAIRSGYASTAVPYLAGWCAANVYLLFVSLRPRTLRLPNKVQPTDGLLFFQTLRYSEEEIAQTVLFNNARRELSSEGDELEKLDVSELIEKHTSDPSNLAVLVALSFRLSHEQDPRCLPYLLKLTEDMRVPEKCRSYFLDMYLTHQLYIGRPDDPEEIDKLSQRLIDLSDTISTRGTRGAALVDIGRIAEGKALLQEVLNKTTATIDKSYSLVFLALAYEAEGNLNDARAHAIVAKEVDPNASALGRISHLLEPTQRRS